MTPTQLKEKRKPEIKMTQRPQIVICSTATIVLAISLVAQYAAIRQRPDDVGPKANRSGEAPGHVEDCALDMESGRSLPVMPTGGFIGETPVAVPRGVPQLPVSNGPSPADDNTKEGTPEADRPE